jgi:hypothetical protein
MEILINKISEKIINQIELKSVFVDENNTLIIKTKKCISFEYAQLIAKLVNFKGSYVTYKTN